MILQDIIYRNLVFYRSSALCRSCLAHTLRSGGLFLVIPLYLDADLGIVIKFLLRLIILVLVRFFFDFWLKLNDRLFFIVIKVYLLIRLGKTAQAQAQIFRGISIIFTLGLLFGRHFLDFPVFYFIKVLILELFIIFLIIPLERIQGTQVEAGHLPVKGGKPESETLETCNNSNSIQLYQHSQDKQDCNKIFKGTGPQKDAEEGRQSQEWGDSGHKDIDDLAAEMGNKEVCGTEEDISRDIPGSPQEP